MRRIWLGTAFLAFAGVGFAAGWFWFSPRPDPVASPEVIGAAQRASYWGLSPRWIDWSGEEARFRRIRDRAFAYCYREGAITQACAQEQDEAVHSAVLTLLTVQMQRRMPNRDALNEKARWIAGNPEVVVRAEALCQAFYNSHGGMDARLLSICLSNLIDTSEVVPLPVQD